MDPRIEGDEAKQIIRICRPRRCCMTVANVSRTTCLSLSPVPDGAVLHGLPPSRPVLSGNFE
jgi:hypothetical protein